MFWAGTKGVIATPHFDSVYNVYVHLSGEKIFRLVAPRYFTYMKFYGRVHPHRRQSRLRSFTFPQYYSMPYYGLNASCVCDTLDSLTSISELLVTEAVAGAYPVDEFILRPGDVLFIPPFWVHEVCAGFRAMT